MLRKVFGADYSVTKNERKRCIKGLQALDTPFYIDKTSDNHRLC